MSTYLTAERILNIAGIPATAETINRLAESTVPGTSPLQRVAAGKLVRGTTYVLDIAGTKVPAVFAGIMNDGHAFQIRHYGKSSHTAPAYTYKTDPRFQNTCNADLWVFTVNGEQMRFRKEFDDVTHKPGLVPEHSKDNKLIGIYQQLS